MKQRLFNLLGMAVLFTAVFVASCADPCKDVTCVNGTCEDGDCLCDAGYEGTDCGTAMNAKFAGSFTTTEACGSGNYTYTITITGASGNAEGIVISNLYEGGMALSASLTGSTTFSFTNGTIKSGITGTGTGTITADGTTITITYTATDGTTNDNCTATLTRL